MIGEHCTIFRGHHNIDKGAGGFQIGRSLQHRPRVDPAVIALLGIDISDVRLFVTRPQRMTVPNPTMTPNFAAVTAPPPVGRRRIRRANPMQGAMAESPA